MNSFFRASLLAFAGVSLVSSIEVNAQQTGAAGAGGAGTVQTPVQDGLNSGLAVTGDSLESRFSLMYGYDSMKPLVERGLQVDVEAMIRGIRMAAAGEPSPVGEEEAMLIAQQIGQKIRAAEAEMRMKVGAENEAKGAAFLEQNAKAPGVEVLPSGLQYRLIQAGTGATPIATDLVQIHYTGRFVDGTEFQTTEGRQPMELEAGKFVPGMSECLLRMKVGEKCQIAIPSALGYGANAPEGIGPNQTLVFDLELVGFQPHAAAPGGQAPGGSGPGGQDRL